jgi:AbrB family looped-hinge helix DNA binding protein
MSIATISSKGQITLPAQARKALGIRAHDRIRIRVADGGCSFGLER